MKSRVEPWVGFVLLLVCLFAAGPAQAQGISRSVVSSFNGRMLQVLDGPGAFSFLAVGHAYGSPGNMRSPFPSPSLLTNVDTINDAGAAFVMSLGDNVREPGHIPRFREFLQQIRRPVFNAVGNHDVVDREAYHRNFGATWSTFRHHGCLFVILDLEGYDNPDLEKQLPFLQAALEAHEEAPSPGPVFVFSHKLYWARDIPRYQPVYQALAKIKDAYDLDAAIVGGILEALRDTATRHPVYWICGDYGPYDLTPFLLEKDPDHDITYVATGIADTDEDALLRVDVDANQQVKLSLLSLTGEDLGDVNDHGMDVLAARVGLELPPPGGRSLLEEAQRALVHKYFWVGGLVATLGCGVLALLARRRG